MASRDRKSAAKIRAQVIGHIEGEGAVVGVHGHVHRVADVVDTPLVGMRVGRGTADRAGILEPDQAPLAYH
jgi:hypothetical protein